MSNSPRRLGFLLQGILLVNLVGVYFFEPVWLFRLLLTIIAIWAVIIAIRHYRYELLIILSFYLSFFNLYFLYQSLSLPLWVMAILAAGLAAIFFAIAIRWQSRSLNPLDWIYSLFIGLASAEVFLILSLWPTSITTRSVLITVAFYIIWRLIVAHIRHQITPRLVWQYLVFGTIVIALILTTSIWYDTL